MLDKLKDTFLSKELTCTKCGRKIGVGERFTAILTMPSEKDMLVSRLDNAIARTADSVSCEGCK